MRPWNGDSLKNAKKIAFCEKLTPFLISNLLLQVLTTILSRKNSVFFVDISWSVSRVLIYLANTVVVNDNQLFILMTYNNVLSYCSTGSIVIGVMFAELTLYGIPWAAQMYCYKQYNIS